mmetsp:Transcript_12434/g.22555  ORF Transcript_12434/g.22555 Transcript_12434/m.22555 type:complete len:125 (-) Transcript_12434:93-467(-)
MEVYRSSTVSLFTVISGTFGEFTNLAWLNMFARFLLLYIMKSKTAIMMTKMMTITTMVPANAPELMLFSSCLLDCELGMTFGDDVLDIVVAVGVVVVVGFGVEVDVIGFNVVVVVRSIPPLHVL